MQFALPTLVSDWRGVPSLVKDGETGFIIPTKSVIGFTDKLDLLCRDSNLMRQMGNKARNHFLTNYSLEKFVNRLEYSLLKISGVE